MPLFIDVLAKKYDPSNIDGNMFAMNYSAPHCVPIVATEMVAEGSGRAFVDGVEIPTGKCVKFDFSPMPILFLPVGEVIKDFGRAYTVRLEGYKSVSGRSFLPFTYKLKTPEKRSDFSGHSEADASAKAVSDEGIVLLENNGILPIAENEKIALVGKYQDFRIGAIGACAIKPRWYVSVREALGRVFEITDKADTALYFISRDSGEGRDNRAIKGGYYLTDKEKREIEDTKRKYKRVILVLSTGYPIEGEYIREQKFDAVLWCGFSGQAGVLSLTDILCGRVSPSGRLSDTWPLDYYHTPSSCNFINLDKDELYSDDGQRTGAKIYYEEGVFVGYRYFDSYGKDVAYSFGHGLSYSSFENEIKADFANNNLQIEAKIANIGEHPAKTSLLFYVKSPIGKIKKPRCIFAGFEKSSLLEAGEAEILHLSIPAADFAVFDDGMSAFVLEGGEYKLLLGGSVSEAREVFSFTLDGDVILDECVPCSRGYTELLREDDGLKTEMVPRECVIEKPKKYVKHTPRASEKYIGKRISFSELEGNESLIPAFVSQLSISELVDFTVCAGSCYQPWGSGAAGRLAHSKKYGIPEVFMSDGNCGVNIKKRTTGFPATNLLASTFNKSMAYEVGRFIAEDSRESGILVNLGPAGNLHRNILSGRHPEYHSEDPILAGTMMAYQAMGLEENGVAATYKHLLANNIEFERKSAHSIMDERTLHELYLRVFGKAFSIYKPSCVMTSYNPVNGIYPSENEVLLQKILRKAWGFEGFIMTDWGSCDTADAVKSVNAGTNLLTPGGRKMRKMIYKAARAGEISRDILEESVGYIISVLIKFCGANACREQ